MMNFSFHMKVRFFVDSAHVRRVRLPSMHQFSIIDKNKGKYYAKKKNKYCFSTLHCSLLGKQISGILLIDNCSKKNYLFSFPTGPFIVTGGHEWTTPFPPIDRMHNIGKCKLTCAVFSV